MFSFVRTNWLIVVAGFAFFVVFAGSVGHWFGDFFSHQKSIFSESIDFLDYVFTGNDVIRVYF